MDEFNNNAYDEAYALVTAMNGGERSFDKQTMQEEASLAPLFSTQFDDEALPTT